MLRKIPKPFRDKEWEDAADVVIFRLIKAKKKRSNPVKSMKTGANKDFCSFNSWTQTCMLILLLLAVPGSTLRPKRLISRRHRESMFLPWDYHIQHLQMGNQDVQVPTDWSVTMQRSVFWLANFQKLKLDLLSHYSSYRLSFLRPGANSPSTCYSTRKNVGPFHTPYASEKAPQKNYSRGDNGNFSWITAAVSDREKEYSSLILCNKTLAEMSNLQVNWEGLVSFRVDYY